MEKYNGIHNTAIQHVITTPLQQTITPTIHHHHNTPSSPQHTITPIIHLRYQDTITSTAQYPHNTPSSLQYVISPIPHCHQLYTLQIPSLQTNIHYHHSLLDICTFAIHSYCYISATTKQHKHTHAESRYTIRKM